MSGAKKTTMTKVVWIISKEKEKSQKAVVSIAETVATNETAQKGLGGKGKVGREARVRETRREKERDRNTGRPRERAKERDRVVRRAAHAGGLPGISTDRVGRCRISCAIV